MSALAYLCVHCDRCDETIAAQKAERINGRAHCRPCAREARTETCPVCGHLMLDVHTALGCLVETAAGFCPCGPPMLTALPLAVTGSR
jgi:hypothetical protein